MDLRVNAVLASSFGALLLVQPADGRTFAVYGSQTTDSSPSGWGLVKFNTNPLNGTSTRVGHGGLMFDFDFDSSGVLYSPDGTYLRKVNTTTGVQTLVGAFGITPIITSVAFSPNGTLYGTDNEGANTSLYTINKQTGSATRVGAVGNYVFGLDFAPDGTLYGASGEIFTINTATGAEGQVVVPYTGPFITALDYGADHVFRGVESFYNNSFSALREINLDGQSLSLVGQTTESQMQGLASIPSPSGSLLLGVVAAGRLARRRR